METLSIPLSLERYAICSLTICSIYFSVFPFSLLSNKGVKHIFLRLAFKFCLHRNYFHMWFTCICVVLLWRSSLSIRLCCSFLSCCWFTSVVWFDFHSCSPEGYWWVTYADHYGTHFFPVGSQEQWMAMKDCALYQRIKQPWYEVNLYFFD